MNAEVAGRKDCLLGRTIVRRIDQLAAISADPERLERIFLSPEHRAAADQLLGWMREAGMTAHVDAIGNVCGRYEGDRPGLPLFDAGVTLRHRARRR